MKKWREDLQAVSIVRLVRTERLQPSGWCRVSLYTHQLTETYYPSMLDSFTTLGVIFLSLPTNQARRVFR